MEHMVVLIEPGAQIQPKDIPQIGGERPVGEAALSPPTDGDTSVEASYRATRERLLAQFERKYLQHLVALAGGKRLQWQASRQTQNTDRRLRGVTSAVPAPVTCAAEGAGAEPAFRPRTSGWRGGAAPPFSP